MSSSDKIVPDTPRDSTASRFDEVLASLKSIMTFPSPTQAHARAHVRTNPNSRVLLEVYTDPVVSGSLLPPLYYAGSSGVFPTRELHKEATQ